MAPHLLIIGGADSGKSALAQRLAEALCPTPVYLATATAGDEEMARRIARHKAQRDSRWRTVEEPIRIAQVLGELEGVVVVDCLGMWVSNMMMRGMGEQEILEQFNELIGRLGSVACRVIFVSQEVGLGIVPGEPVARAYRVIMGRAHQMLVGAGVRAVLVIAGIPLVLKPFSVEELLEEVGNGS